MPSLQSRIVEWLLPLTGAKRDCSSEEAIREAVARERRRGPALPSLGMRRRLSVQEQMLHGSRVFTIAPREGLKSCHVLYLHGGSYVFEISAPHWRLIEKLIVRLACTVTVPLYPLAPEHTWRDVFASVTPLYEALVEKAGAANLTIMGDSAGGGLALALAQEFQDRRLPSPARLVMISPGLDFTFSDPLQPELSKIDRMLDIPGPRAAGRWYAGDLPPTDRRISPLYGSLGGLPPMALFMGTHDLLLTDARRLKVKAEQEGASLAYFEYEGMIHVWPAAPVPEAELALDQMAEFIKNAPT